MYSYLCIRTVLSWLPLCGRSNLVPLIFTFFQKFIYGALCSLVPCFYKYFVVSVFVCYCYLAFFHKYLFTCTVMLVHQCISEAIFQETPQKQPSFHGFIIFLEVARKKNNPNAFQCWLPVLWPTHEAEVTTARLETTVAAQRAVSLQQTLKQ